MAFAIGNIGKVPELRRRILFTLAILAIYRVGVFITIPGVNRAEERAGASLGDHVLHLDAVDARNRDEHPEPIDGEDGEREQDPATELRDLADIADRECH